MRVKPTPLLGSIAFTPEDVELKLLLTSNQHLFMIE